MQQSFSFTPFPALQPKAEIKTQVFTFEKPSAKQTLGRPAKACFTCRKRKVKCDLRSPSCSSCKQNGWQCDGVKGTSTYRFRNENGKTKSRVGLEQSHHRIFRTSSTRLENIGNVSAPATRTFVVTKAHESPAKLRLYSEGRSGTDVSKAQHPWQSMMSIGIDIEELSIAYFLTAHTYGWVGQPVNVTDGNGCLLASIKALGLAGLSRFDTGSRISRRAQTQYLEALTLTNTALQSQDYLRRDSTLLAIYILSIFETTVGMRKSTDRWRQHVKGATSLLYMRGAEQFKTSTGGRLFCQVAISLAISCIQERVPLPDHFRLVMREARQSLQEVDTLWRFCEIGFRFVDLYASLSPGNFPKSQANAEKALHEACDIDNAISAFYGDLPDSWSYERIDSNDRAAITGYYHIYRTSLIASTLNALRCMRIFLSDIMLKAFELCPPTVQLRLSPRQLDRVRMSPQSVKCSLQDILASVPQHLSQSSEKSNSGFQLPMAAGLPGPADKVWENFRSMDVNPWQDLQTSAVDLPRVRMAGGFLLQWSLYVAGILNEDDEALRTWIIRVLQNLGNHVGVKYALELASQLETR